MSHAPADDRAERRTTTFLFAFALLVVVAAVVGFLLWGLPALTMLALAATLLVYGMLAAYAAGL